MMRRPLILPFLVLLLASLAALPACKKKKTESGGGGGTETTPSPAQVSSVSSDYLLFAHLKAKDIRDSTLFAEIKQAFDKSGGKADWDEMEGKAAKEIGGVKPTDIDAVTIYVTEVPKNAMPKMVLIVEANKPFNKTGVFHVDPQAKPDARGFYTVSGPDRALVHFPDDKTLVVLHPDLAQKYLDGYAKSRSGWPVSAELSRAAAGHTLFAIAHMDKVPNELTTGPVAQFGGPLLSAKTVTLTADLKGKELSISARAAFPDAASAGKARETVQGFIGMGAGFLANFSQSKDVAEFNSAIPAIKEAQRALKDAKVEVSGNDLVVSGSYKADFDIGAMVVQAVGKIKGSAERMTQANSLKQVVLALINYADTNNGFAVIHAAGPNGLPLKTANDKPLLSWRVAILPYIEQVELYKQFKLNEPWDSPNNKKLIEKMPKIFASPKPGKPGYTHVQMVIGPNALSPVGTKFPTSFPDGMSSTIAVVEAAEPVIWTKPDDVMLTGKELPKDLKKKFGGLFPGGFNVGMWDGSVRFVSDMVSDQSLANALNPKDGKIPGNDW
jgi:prepilin-type processing-associated H-X9-DG protein